MKRFMAVAILLAAAGFAFAQDPVAPVTEDDAMEMLLQQSTQLRLAAKDSATAADAFKAMVQAGIEVQNAYRLVSDALDKGLSSADMSRLAEQVRTRAKLGDSSAACEIAARTMIKQQLQTQTRTMSSTSLAVQTETQTETQTRTQTKTQTISRVEAPAEGGSQSGPGPQAGSGEGSQSGKGK
jgi:hypothetical protein